VRWLCSMLGIPVGLGGIMEQVVCRDPAGKKKGPERALGPCKRLRGV